MLAKRIIKKLLWWRPKAALSKAETMSQSSNELWNYFGRTAAALPYATVDPNLRNQFERDGRFVGTFSPGLVTAFLEAMERAADVPFRADDFIDRYIHNDLSPYLEGLKNDHTWVEINAEIRWLIAEMIDEIRPLVSSCIGGEWRVLNLRFWKTHPNAREAAAHAWHDDGFVPEVLKIMSYFSEVGPGKGALEMQLPGGVEILEGSPGTWMLFKNSAIKHRALAPAAGAPERIALEITLCRSAAPDAWPVFAGLNCSYPYFPWVKARN